MILCVTSGIQEELLGKNMKCYKERWNEGTVIENDECKLCWDFEYDLRKTTSAERPDLTMKYKNKIFFIDVASPSKSTVDAKHAEKLKKYQQLALKIRERRPRYNVVFFAFFASIGIHSTHG